MCLQTKPSCFLTLSGKPHQGLVGAQGEFKVMFFTFNHVLEEEGVGDSGAGKEVGGEWRGRVRG